MCEDKSSQWLGTKKERLIETLLIVAGFVLAGSYSSGNTLFYYATFAFFTFAIITRALAACNTTNTVYSMLYILFSLFMAITFPLIFVSYFHAKVLQLTTGFTLVCSTVVITALTLLLFISLVEGLYPNVIEYLKKRKRGCLVAAFILLFVLVFLLDFWLLQHLLVGNTDAHLPEYVAQNTSTPTEKSLFEGVVTSFSPLLAALLAGLFTLVAVRYEGEMKIKHQKKSIAMGLYYDIKAIEPKINQLIFIFNNYGIYEGGKLSPHLGRTLSLHNSIIESTGLDNKPLYSESGLYYQFIKDIYVFDDELVQKIVEFYGNIVRADEVFQRYKRYIKEENTPSALSTLKYFTDYIYKSHKIRPDLINELERYVTHVDSTPAPEST